MTKQHPDWLKQVEERIGVSFRNKDLLWQAFVHRSFLNENPEYPLESNERLEFLGSRALELVIGDFLYRNYSYDKGTLTGAASALARDSACAKIANDLGLSEFLLLSKGQRRLLRDGEGSRILGNTLEALIGALYLDRGLGVVEIFVSEYMLKELPSIIDEMLYVGSKTHLQELAHEKLHTTPHYEVLEEKGPGHGKAWTVGVFIGDRRIGVGQGQSKKEAETEAAKDALAVEFFVPTKD